MGGGKGGPCPRGFSHMIPLVCFSTSTSFVKTFQLSSTILVFLLRWLTLRGRWLRTNGHRNTEFFRKKMAWNFLKKVGIFSKIGVSPKKVFTFYARLLMQVSSRWALDERPVRPSTCQAATDKVERGLLVLFLGLSFSIASPPPGIWNWRRPWFRPLIQWLQLPALMFSLSPECSWNSWKMNRRRSQSPNYRPQLWSTKHSREWINEKMFPNVSCFLCINSSFKKCNGA